MKRKRNESQATHLNPSSFFKIMHFPSTQFKMLRIPRTFAETLHNELSNEVFLRVPTGETRKVSLIKEGNGLWFCDGWQEFVKHFSIGSGYFLLFKYEGDLTFIVHIFDLTACEIHYQCSKRDTPEVPHEHRDKGINVGSDEYDHDESFEILQSTSNGSSKSDRVDDHHDGGGDEEKKNGIESTPHSKGYPLWLKKYEELINVTESAGFPIPKNPFFVAAIKPYNLKRYLYVPTPFGVGHLGCEDFHPKLVKLEAYNGRQWETHCVKYNRKCSLMRGWASFVQENGLQVGNVCLFELTNVKQRVLKVHVVQRSDKDFQTFHDNHHQASPRAKRTNEKVILLDSDEDDVDTDVKEMHNGRKRTQFGYPLWMRKYEGLMNTVTTAGITLPKYPFFITTIKSYNLGSSSDRKGILNIPNPFRREHLRCANNQQICIKLEACDGRQWEVYCARHPGKWIFCGGWRPFAQDIGLHVGDICIFELIKAKNRVLKVHVVKKSNNTSQVLHQSRHQVCSNDNNKCTKLRHSPPVNLQKSNIELTQLDSEDDQDASDDSDEKHNEREYTKSVLAGYPLWMRKYQRLMDVVTAAGYTLPGNPFFITAMKSYNVTPGAYLNVPTPFCQEHFGCEVKQGKFIKLEGPDGTQRNVYCLRDSIKFSFRQGWRIFSQDTGLNVGDICIFELTNVKKSVLKVHVVKRSHHTSQVLHENQGFDYDTKESPKMGHAPFVSLKSTNVEVILLDSSDEDDQKVSDDEEMHDENEYTEFGYPLWMKKYEGLMNVVTAAGISLPENPFFLAAIKHYNVQREVLNVPKPFGKRHLRQHKLIQLEAPDGSLWEVDCYRDCVKFALCKGWKTFARSIGLKVGEVCIFEVINEKTCVLKVHVVKKSNNTSQVLHESRHQVCNTGHNKRTKLRHSPPVNLKKSNIELTQLDSENDQDASDDSDEKNNEREYPKSGHPLWMRKYQGLMNVVTAAGYTLPGNPFFITAIKSYNVKLGAYLNVPAPFGHEHFGCEVEQGKFIKLEGPDGTQRKVYCFRDSIKFAFRQGWRIFSQDTGLNVGDICIFELTNVKKPVLKVHVVKMSHNTSQVLHENQGFDYDTKESPKMGHAPSVSLKSTNVEVILLDRSDEDDQKVSDEEKHDENEYTEFGYPLWMKKYEGLIKVVTAAGISLPENPFFLAAMKHYNLQTEVLNVPKPFGERHLRQHKLIHLEAPDGSLWEVDCYRDSVKFALCKGWKIFARSIGLKVGDVGIFEVINEKTCVLKVHVVTRSQIKAEEDTF